MECNAVRSRHDRSLSLPSQSTSSSTALPDHDGSRMNEFFI